MQSIPCDIVLLPDTDLATKATLVSEQLESRNTLYTLNKSGPFPHVSLYMTQLKKGNLPQAVGLLAAIAGKTPPLTLASAQFGQAEGYIDADYQRFAELNDLQTRVIDAINPIRDGMREKDKARLATATGTVRFNLETYGYRGVGELFRPHLSLTRFADGNEIDTIGLPDPSTLSGSFTALGLFEMGDNGTCVRKIASFDLVG